ALISALLETSARARTGQRIFAAHVPGQGEADRSSRDDTVAADVPLVTARIGIPEPRARGRGRCLPAVAKPLGEGQVHAMIVRPALQELKVYRAPLRESPPADVAEAIVGSCRRVVRQVHLLRAFFAPASGVDTPRFAGLRRSERKRRTAHIRRAGPFDHSGRSLFPGAGRGCSCRVEGYPVTTAGNGLSPSGRYYRCRNANLG